MEETLDNIIVVTQIGDTTTATFKFYKNGKAVLDTTAYIGRNGTSDNKVEGDAKTPLGTFGFSTAFGTHDRSEFKLSDTIDYVKVKDSLYWVDDPSSEYYNQLEDTDKVEKTWKSAEHLIDYPIHYEYAINILTNPKNIPGKGSAVFLHCAKGTFTGGCIAIKSAEMITVYELINSNTRIKICRE